jgi:hypothetical protein
MDSFDASRRWEECENVISKMLRTEYLKVESVFVAFMHIALTTHDLQPARPKLFSFMKIVNLLSPHIVRLSSSR